MSSLAHLGMQTALGDLKGRKGVVCLLAEVLTPSLQRLSPFPYVSCLCPTTVTYGPDHGVTAVSLSRGCWSSKGGPTVP